MPPALTDPRQRYLHEPLFHTLVDSLIAILNDGLLTPDDIRSALRLAVKELTPSRRHGHTGVPVHGAWPDVP